MRHPSVLKLRVNKFIRSNASFYQGDFNEWARNWASHGFNSLGTLFRKDNNRGDFRYGDQPGLLGCYLLPNYTLHDDLTYAFDAISKALGSGGGNTRLESIQAALLEAEIDAIEIGSWTKGYIDHTWSIYP
jgi:hypothetical protein